MASFFKVMSWEGFSHLINRVEKEEENNKKKCNKNHKWPSKPKTFTIVPLTENVFASLVQANDSQGHMRSSSQHDARGSLPGSGGVCFGSGK